MRAIVIHAAKDLRVEPMELTPMGEGQVTVRIEAGGICGSDLHYFNHGGFGLIRLREPMVLGHEIVGVVVETAPGVTAVTPGDRVAVNPSRPCGQCAFCREGLQNHCSDMRFYGSAMRMPHVQGGFRQLLVCDAAQCERAEHATTSQLALAEPFAVALHAVARAGDVTGRRVLVTGCGPIGALVVAAARHKGAAEVIVTDVVDEPLAIAARLGATAGINAAADPEAMAALAAGKGTIDIMVECSGNERALRAGLDAVRPRGQIIQLGLGGDVPLAQNIVVAKEIAISGSFRFQAEFAEAVHLIDTGTVDLGPLLTGTFGLDDARLAFETAGDRRRSMKVQLAF